MKIYQSHYKNMVSFLVVIATGLFVTLEDFFVFVMIATLFFIVVFSFFAYKAYKERILAYDEVAKHDSTKVILSPVSGELQKCWELEKGQSTEFSDSTDSEDELHRENVARYYEHLLRDLVFERILASIVMEIDAFTFTARFCDSNLKVLCYLAPQLYDSYPRPSMGSLVRLEYSWSFGPRGYGYYYYIIQVLSDEIKKGYSWVLYTVYAEVIGDSQYDEDDDLIIYTRLIESEEIVLCRVLDHLRETNFNPGDLVYLEVDERYKLYYVIEIVERNYE